MADLHGFDASRVDPTAPLDPVPAGEYLAVVVESEFKPTKANDGRFLELKFQIIDGPYQGRNVWARLNLENKNDTAVKIAKAELSAICRAVNIMQPRDSQELHNLPLIVVVKLKKRKDTDELSNVIAGYKRREVPTANAPQPATAGSPAPWKR